MSKKTSSMGKNSSHNTGKRTSASTSKVFGAGAVQRLQGSSASRLQAGKGRSLAELAAEKSRKSAPIPARSSNSRKSNSSSSKSYASNEYLDPEEEEIRYLQRKLGIKTTDDLADDSRLIRELKMDGMADLFDIMLPEITHKVEKGRKSVAKFSNRLAAAVEKRSLSDSDFSEEEFPMVSMQSDDDTEDRNSQDDEEEYDNEELPANEASASEVSHAVSEDDEDEDEFEKQDVQLPKRSIQEALQQKRLQEKPSQAKVTAAQGLKRLAQLEAKPTFTPNDSESDTSSDDNSESDDEDLSVSSDTHQDSDASDSDQDELSYEEDIEEDFVIDEDYDGDTQEDDAETSDDGVLEDEKKGPQTRRPDIFGRDIAEQNKHKGEGATLLATQTSLAQLLSGQSNGVSKYIPPHLRRKLAAEGVYVDASGRTIDAQAALTSDDSKAKLRASAAGSSSTVLSAHDPQLRLRQAVTGILNKITSDNADAMHREISKLIERHSRGDVVDALCFCTLEIILSQPRLLPAIIIAIGGIVACYHRKEGTHVGSLFMEKTVREIQAHINDPSQLNRTNLNAGPHLIVFLCALFQFKVISAQLIIETLSHVTSDCKSWSDAVSLLHRGLQYGGLAIRKEEPGLLKELILLIQRRVKAESSGTTQPVGHEAFMLETLSNVRNNKPTTEDNERELLIKTLLRWLEKEDAKNERQLAVTWDDIMRAEDNGRWWLVGAAFKQTSLLGNKRGAPSNTPSDGGNLKRRLKQDQDEGSDVELDGASEDALTKAAIAQGMNTNVRRAVFSIIMGSSDFLEAYEKISKLNLSAQQCRQAMRVVFHCCAQEQAFNPYYGAVLSKLCGRDKDYKFTAQLVLWDVLKEWRSQGDDAGSQTSIPRQVSNVGRMVALCVEYHAMPLMALKQLDFDNLEPTDLLFLQAFFSQLFSRVTSKSELQTISNCVVAKREVDVIRNGIRYFLQHYMIRLLKKKKDLQTLAVAKHFIGILE